MKKGVDMALRALGKRNETLRRAAVDLAGFLARGPEPSRAWIGKSALRELSGRGADRRELAEASARAERGLEVQ